MDIQKTPLQIPYEFCINTKTYTVEFTAVNQQFNVLEISLVYYKNDKHSTIYNSYNVKAASTSIQSVSIENVTNMYSVANEFKFYIKTYAFCATCCMKL